MELPMVLAMMYAKQQMDEEDAEEERKFFKSDLKLKPMKDLILGNAVMCTCKVQQFNPQCPYSTDLQRRVHSSHEAQQTTPSEQEPPGEVETEVVEDNAGDHH